MYIMFGVFIAGIVCFVIGSNRAEELATINPGLDFEPLGFGDERRFACEITGVDHTEDSYYRARTKDRKEEARCDDIYSYHFQILVPPRNSSVEYQSREEEFRRSSVNTYINFLPFYVFLLLLNVSLVVSCRTGTPRQSTFQRGEKVPCWAPVKGDSNTLSEYYRCKNRECIKLFDPNEEILDANDTASSLETAGKVMLPLGLVFVVVLLAVLAGMIKSDSLD